MAAARETPPAWVGTCPACGGYLRPRPPTTVSSTRIDYEADCVQPDCGKSILAPGGRLQGRRYTRPRGM